MTIPIPIPDTGDMRVSILGLEVMAWHDPGDAAYNEDPTWRWMVRGIPTSPARALYGVLTPITGTASDRDTATKRAKTEARRLIIDTLASYGITP